MDLDLDYYVKKHPNVLKKEMVKITENVNSVNKPDFCKSIFESRIESLDYEREKEKVHGKPSVRATPLIQVLSVDVRPIGLGKRKSLGVFGQIYAANHYLYNREFSNLETLGADGGKLTLSGPSFSCQSSKSILSPQSTKLSIRLRDEGHNLLIQDSLSFDYVDGEFEEVKSKCIRGDEVVFNLKYVLIPMAVYARLDLRFFNKRYSRRVAKFTKFLNVYGTIIAKYRNTFGNYDYEEIVLFEKKNSEYERLGVDTDNELALSRGWVTLPAYSLLIIHLKLFEYGSGDKIIEETVEFEAKSCVASGESFVVGDLAVTLDVAWFTPDDKVDDKLFEDTDDDDTDDDAYKSTLTLQTKRGDNELLQPAWTLHPHMSKPWPSPAIEVFSVTIGREKWKEIDIYGSIVVSYDYDDCVEFTVFRKDDESAAVRLFEGMKSLPMLVGSRVFEYCRSLKIKCDLKDVTCHPPLKINGYVDWNAEVLNSSLYHDRHLCSVIQGEYGFAALHYTIFSSAVQANLKVILKQKRLADSVHALPSVCGSLFAQCSKFEYLSTYSKQWYRTTLFKRMEEDLVHVDSDGMIPLLRSVVIVPSDSFLVIDVDLTLVDQRLLYTQNFEIGASSARFEMKEYDVCFELEWSDVK